MRQAISNVLQSILNQNVHIAVVAKGVTFTYEKTTGVYIQLLYKVSVHNTVLCVAVNASSKKGSGAHW